MIRKAVLGDLNGVMEIMRKTISKMNAESNYQTDKNYYQEKDFRQDIEKGNLFVDEVSGIQLGFISVNKTEPAEYKGLNWSSGEEAMVVHSMGVNPSYRRKGIGSELMEFAEELALKNNVFYLKTDTNSSNTNTIEFFAKCGYKFIGKMSFLGKEKPFYCYDKLI